VGQMARSIIHDIKNPLTIIRAQAELLEGDERLTRRCQSILRNADHITNMANDLLDFSRGAVSLKLQQIAPKAWLDDVLGLLKPMTEGRNITLNSEVLTTDLLQIDPDRMTRAVYNLAGNAVQAMQGEGTLTVGIARDQQGFEITITDNGPGIPEEIRDRLFDPFVTSSKKNGTGLGTSIAKKIIEDHGGQISFQTQTGIGTTFRIRLPGTVQS
jgi:signal transduction histidine kinase